METKTFIEGIAIGAVAGAIAGLLLAPKSGEDTREDIADELVALKDSVAERLEKLQELTKEKYEEAVAAVLAEYVAAKKIPAKQAEELGATLRDGYETVRKTIHEQTAPAPKSRRKA